ncbi:hypothetical protein LOTGIDRAFT_114901 [Lottia gigantea]|uniref:Coronin n=1 Tax=Lottia gigantea TaxID=225164 RepID=V4AU58_LOTGI|nr:hypothetical protein LOTGIDRAFT_114901 [Lottia gigantea]ESO97311.1 hypothetical protein LOTGIDRAFT_114901 [Lottia gigantea]
MRNSKFRHVFGKALRREQCYDNIRITRSSWDAAYCAVNPKFVAVVTEAAGGGAFLVLPLSKVGRIERDCPLVAGHRDSVLDIAWCPHDDNLIASSSEDCTIKVWEIPDEGILKENLTESMVDLEGHTKRVGHIVWHPTAQHVLLSAGCDNFIYIWDVGTGTAMIEIQTNDQPYCASFNLDGSKFALTCKDKKLYVYDSHTGKVLQEGDSHNGAKQSRCIYLKNGLVFTTGFSKRSDRRYTLHDENDLSKPLVEQDIDKTNGVIFPFYDPDVNMVYLCGKGDSSIRYYEIGELNGKPNVFYLEMYQSKDPQKGFGFMPKRALNVNSCEIARIYKLHNSGLCEAIPFTVPRKSDLFQEDLYPDTVGDTPAITAEEFFSGKNAEPLLVSIVERL